MSDCELYRIDVCVFIPEPSMDEGDWQQRSYKSKSFKELSDQLRSLKE